MSLFGEILSSTAVDRFINISSVQFRKGVTAPSDVVIGTTPTIPALNFSAVNELASAFVEMPGNWDKDFDCILALAWSLSQVETNNDALDVTVDYVVARANTTGGGIAKASTQLTPSTIVTTANGLAIGDLYVMLATISALDGVNGFSGGDNSFAIALEIHLTNLVGVAEANLIGGAMGYRGLY